mgnify:CR=1 FL=1
MGYEKFWPHVGHEARAGFPRRLTLALCNIKKNVTNKTINVNQTPQIFHGLYGGFDMKREKASNKANKIEQEIVRKERLARDAKNKGMHAVYSNYVMDISVLKAELQKLSTGPIKST